MVRINRGALAIQHSNASIPYSAIISEMHFVLIENGIRRGVL